MQSQRFALQELLKQFLLMHHYCTCIFLVHKKADPTDRILLTIYVKQYIGIKMHCQCAFLRSNSCKNPILPLFLLLCYFPFMHTHTMCVLCMISVLSQSLSFGFLSVLQIHILIQFLYTLRGIHPFVTIIIEKADDTATVVRMIHDPSTRWGNT